MAIVLLVLGSAAGCVHHPGLPATGTTGYEAKASSTADAAISSVATVRLVLDAESKGHTTERYLASVVSDQEDRLEEVVSSFSAVAPPTAAARSLRPQVMDALGAATEHVTGVRIALDAGEADEALAMRPALDADVAALEQFES